MPFDADEIVSVVKKAFDALRLPLTLIPRPRPAGAEDMHRILAAREPQRPDDPYFDPWTGLDREFEARYGGPATLSGVGGSTSGTPSTPVSSPPKVKVTAGSQAIQGITVHFAVTAGGGKVDVDPTAVTDSQGTVAVKSWTLGPNPGENKLHAKVGTKTIEFTAKAS